jgi:hypothetical protein
MNKLLILFLGGLFPVVSFGQLVDNYTLTFDNPSSLLHLSIDTFSNKNNIWQIGPPEKTVFTAAFSEPNVIVTSTKNPYPINDTSFFIITYVAHGHGFGPDGVAGIQGSYYIDSDTLKDFGKIEFSPNKGKTWIDIVNDSVLIDTSYNIYWPGNNFLRPTLTGKSIGWTYIFIDLASLGYLYNIHDGDTVLYRFSFISDNIQSNKDGLMFDDISFFDVGEGIQNKQIENLLISYPNPVSEFLKIQKINPNDIPSIQIYDSKGQLMYFQKKLIDETINIRDLNNGIYFLRYSDTKNVYTERFVVNH